MFASDFPFPMVPGGPAPAAPRDRNGSRGHVQVGTKVGRKRATDADVVAKVWPVVATMVQQAEADAGGKMLAYDAVGRELGETGSWVRKLLGRRAVQVTAATYLNITAAYLELCARAEKKAAANKADALALAAELLGDRAQP